MLQIVPQNTYAPIHDAIMARIEDGLFFLEIDKIVARHLYAQSALTDQQTLCATINHGRVPAFAKSYILKRAEAVHEDMLKAFKDGGPVLNHLLSLPYDDGVPQGVQPSKTRAAKPRTPKTFVKLVAERKPAKTAFDEASPKPKRERIPTESVSFLIKPENLRQGDVYKRLYDAVLAFIPNGQQGWGSKNRAIFIVDALIDPATPGYPQSRQAQAAHFDVGMESFAAMRSNIRRLVREDLIMDDEMKAVAAMARPALVTGQNGRPKYKC